MSLDVVIYCPDTHIRLHAGLGDRAGVGGGLMARLRLAEALARQRHRVTMIAHVESRHRHRGVEYLPLGDTAEPRRADVLVMSSSGGALSLEPAMALNVDAGWREIWVHGSAFLQGVDRLSWDAITPVSNFLHGVLAEAWPLRDPNLFTIYNGTPGAVRWRRRREARRDPHRLVYAGHPSKGLQAARGVLSRLRASDRRYHLDVYGGDRLYGGKDAPPRAEDGIRYFGTKGQPAVLRALERASISLHLQDRQEPFGMVLTESMSRGAVPIASRVGAYPELVAHGRNGFLVDADHRSEEAQELAVRWIEALRRDPEYATYVRRNGMVLPWTWETMAQTRVGYWRWALTGHGALAPDGERCRYCSGDLLLLADGYHCTKCGRYLHGHRHQAPS